MQKQVRSEATPTPILFPIEPLRFWETIRQIVRRRSKQSGNKKVAISFF